MWIVKIYQPKKYDEERLLKVLYELLTVDSYNTGGNSSNTSTDNDNNSD